MLWFPESALAIVPGWMFNVALFVHGDEALLAIGFIFTIHFFNGHLRPEQVPDGPGDLHRPRERARSCSTSGRPSTSGCRGPARWIRLTVAGADAAPAVRRAASSARPGRRRRSGRSSR